MITIDLIFFSDKRRNIPIVLPKPPQPPPAPPPTGSGSLKITVSNDLLRAFGPEIERASLDKVTGWFEVTPECGQVLNC